MGFLYIDFWVLHLILQSVVAKAKRQLQSTQSERRSTPRFKKGLCFLICHLDFIDIKVFQQHEKLTLNFSLRAF